MQTMDEVGKNKDVLLISREGERERGGPGGGGGGNSTRKGKERSEIKTECLDNCWLY